MKIALAQICTGRDVETNLDAVRIEIAKAAASGAKLVVFPEATMRAFGHNLREVAEDIHGPFADGVAASAKEHGITVVLGMFTPGDGNRVRNSLLITDGTSRSSYDKVHLFDAFGFHESETVTAGERRLVVDCAGTAMGFATCYDVRFPQLFIDNAKDGAGVQIVCASWGAGEGKIDQWRLLTRARALDSTSFVLACGQAEPEAAGVAAASGAPTGIGHSMVVSPFGEILAEAGGEPELLVVDLNLEDVQAARKAIPVLENARSV